MLIQAIFGFKQVIFNSLLIAVYATCELYINSAFYLHKSKSSFERDISYTQN